MHKKKKKLSGNDFGRVVLMNVLRFVLIVPHDARDNQEVLQGCSAAAGNLVFLMLESIKSSRFRGSGGRFPAGGSVDPCNSFIRQEQNKQRNMWVTQHRSDCLPGGFL